MKSLISVCIYLFCLQISIAQPLATTLLVEAESFDTSGWVVDQQSMDQMGSPYLLAHGLGIPVADAVTSVEFPLEGEYRLWVRTRNWVAPWNVPGAPGTFQLLIDGKAVRTVFGTKGAEWHWQEGGIVHIDEKRVTLALRDLTGFDGRCDAILFSTNHRLRPPNHEPALAVFRRKLLGYPENPAIAGEYNVVVVGGGMAGCCTAISAARRGCRVALIQNRPVLGGNNSSEVRVGLSGLIHQAPYEKLGELVDEIGPIGHWTLWEAQQNPESPRNKRILETIKKYPEKTIHNAGPASNYEDQRKISILRNEKNVELYLNMHVNEVEMQTNRITAVVAQNIRSGERLKFVAPLFVDCTGDGNLGFLAKADFRVGRESGSQTGEKLAPEHADSLVMGTSVQWYAREKKAPSSFPLCPWAASFDENSCIQGTRGDWDWETGADRDQIDEIERIRDYALRVIYGNWSVLKNHEQFKGDYATWKLAWVAFIGGKRESRRLLGDVILRQQDIETKKVYADASVTTTWSIDLHYPKKTPGYEGEPFRSNAEQYEIEPYPIPYRCFYSRNINNLMMAGRNISVTHVALGTVRVMRTTSMMGEVVGMAASLCKKYHCDPRQVYSDHLNEFKQLLTEGVPETNHPDRSGLRYEKVSR
ncbi:FAD-dependent oxidoreductase [candidate division KSB1 bacterium]|nr:FAD-dependent oxidoreductase [candidate division KSB1 bacterium]